MEQKKKIDFKKIAYRVIPLVCAVVIAVHAFSPIVAKAGNFNFSTFVTSSGTVAGQDYYILTFPSSYNRFLVQDLTNGGTITQVTNGYHIRVLPEDKVYGTENSNKTEWEFESYILHRPFGAHYIKVEDIANGSVLYYTFDGVLAGFYSVNGYRVSYRRSLVVRYYDANYNALSVNRYDENYLTPSTAFVESFDFGTTSAVSVDIDIPMNATYMQVWCYLYLDLDKQAVVSSLNSTGLMAYNYTLASSNLRLVISEAALSGEVVDKLYDIDDTLTDMNDLLEDTNAQLGSIDNGITGLGVTLRNEFGIVNDQLDDLINGTTGAQNQVAGSVDRLEQSDIKLEQLNDDLQVSKPDIDGDTVSAENILEGYNMQTLAAPLTTVLESPLILRILLCVVTLMIISWVLFGKK